MSCKRTNSYGESGILRKSEFKEKREELFVFGYSCKLFRDNDKALHIDQGKHLIPWMGDETLKIDRYDARGALHDLSAVEAPPGGYDWRVELTKMELDVEQRCDEERYRALHTDEDEEEMYKEEELKRLHAAGYGQVDFNYDAPTAPEPEAQPVEVDEPFIAKPSLVASLPPEICLPDSQKLNAIIEKTATFIATQGAQMEILIKAKQQDNPQFQFLNRESPLHAYYTALIGLTKSGKWPEKQNDAAVEEKPPDHNDEYLHPSLASTIIESAPSIPSIHYRPSADCDYTLLISRMRGEATLDEAYTPELAPGEVAPPGTEPLPVRVSAEIARGPVMYHKGADGVYDHQSQQSLYQQQYAAYYQQYTTPAQPVPPAAHAPAHHPFHAPVATNAPVAKSTGLTLMNHYNTDSDTDGSDTEDSSSSDKNNCQILSPPDDVKVVIDKMAAYVARNGDEFAEIVRAKSDPRFTFLEPNNQFHAYYKRLMQQKRGVDHNGSDKDSKRTGVVSFSIKKMKEPDPILPKPALPYESSTDEETEENQTDKQNDKQEEPEIIKEIKTNVLQVYPPMNMPPVVLYKMEANNVVIKTIEPVPKLIPKLIVPEVNPQVAEVKPVIEEKVEEKKSLEPIKEVEPIKEKEKSPIVEKEAEQIKKKEIPKETSREGLHKREKKKSRDRKEYRTERESRRSADKEKKKEKENDREREKKRRKYGKEELENEIISLEDNSDDMIDLTGDQSDSKGEVETEVERQKQAERRRRAAEFLRKAGVDPAAAALPTTSLASAMVDTLESIRKKKDEEEQKRRRRREKRHRNRYDYENESERSHRKTKRRKYRSSEDNEESDYDGSKRKKRKKDKKSKTKKKKKTDVEEEQDHPLNIDLTNTLKELRASSPTKDLVLQDVEDTQQSKQDSSGEEGKERRKKKKDREYSEGEWSSDSEGDSGSSNLEE